MQLAFSYMVYPLLLVVACLVQMLVYKFTTNYLVSAYIAAFAAGLTLLLLELTKPLENHWKPNLKDLFEDILFYGLGVQVLFPLVISVIFISLLKNAGLENGQLLHIWPSELHPVLQFLLFCVLGEFLQYWWHRLCHSYRFLWPVHAIHHLPQKLYSINTTRFHFLDKLVEFFITIFLFYQLGASLELISYYYIFFAVTGFVQHCNMDVRLGVFDYVIASGETHRFHHDSNPKMSKCNYANNLVVWDLVFKTFKRDLKNPLKDVGMKNTLLNSDLRSETLYPLKHFFKEAFLQVLNLKMHLSKKKDFRALDEATGDPKNVQKKVLFDILKKNEGTDMGRDFKFSEIHSLEDFKRLVPIHDYEDLRPYMDSFFTGNMNAISADAPYYFTKTSGTTGKPKYLPVNLETQKNFLAAQKILTLAIFKQAPKSFDGHIYSVVGDLEEEVINDMWPAGSMSGKFYSLTPTLVRKKYTFDPAIARFEDHEKRYLYLAALALLAPQVTLYAAPNPSTFLKIFEFINTKRGEITRLIENKNDPILKRFMKNQKRAQTLLNRNEELKASDLWPNLEAVVLWMGGSCSYLVPKVRALIKIKTPLIELGYLCSEFCGTMTFDGEKNLQMPTLLHNYFEFIPKDDYDNGVRETKELHELKDQGEYYIIVTTPCGLYRYFINDIVKVNGFYKKTPSLVFSHKGKGVTNLTGEKLSEKQIISFFEESPLLKGKVDFFICLANQEEQNYRLYLELSDPSQLELNDIEEKLHNHLSQMNIEYESKVKSQRLRPIEVVLVRAKTGDEFKAHCIKKGQRESQFKFLYLQYVKDVDFPFESKRLL